MEKIPKIKNQLRRGDIRDIAEMTGYTTTYVKMVFDGVRYNKSIVAAAERLIATRRQLIEDVQRQMRRRRKRLIKGYNTINS